MKIISWNTNSIRTRLPRLVSLLKRHQPDVVCLQETKVTDDAFPRDVIEEQGYRVSCYGQKTYNGVAILSRHAPTLVGRGFPEDPAADQARAIEVEIGGVRLVNLYVINGQTVGSEKYELKLRWLDGARAHLARCLRDNGSTIVVGDFNITPDDRDVCDPEAWRERILCSTAERQRLEHIMALGLVDTFRLHEQAAGHYSWWDYRAGAFPRDQGLRIDLILASNALAARCVSSMVDREERKMSTGEGKPSDHAPVIAEFTV
jgi:exodeoxyribonuclease-3